MNASQVKIHWNLILKNNLLGDGGYSTLQFKHWKIVKGFH